MPRRGSQLKRHNTVRDNKPQPPQPPQAPQQQQQQQQQEAEDANDKPTVNSSSGSGSGMASLQAVSAGDAAMEAVSPYLSMSAAQLAAETARLRDENAQLRSQLLHSHDELKAPRPKSATQMSQDLLLVKKQGPLNHSAAWTTCSPCSHSHSGCLKTMSSSCTLCSQHRGADKCCNASIMHTNRSGGSTHTLSPPACYLRSHASFGTFTSQQVELRVVAVLALMPMVAQLQATSLSSQTARQSPAKHRSKNHPKAAAAASHAARQADAAGGVGRPPRGDARGGDGRAQVADARQGGAVEEDGRGGGLVPADWMTMSLCAAMMSVSLCWTLGTAPAQCPPTTAARHSLKSCHSDRRDTSAAQAAAPLPALAPAPVLALAMAARHPPGTNQ